MVKSSTSCLRRNLYLFIYYYFAADSIIHLREKFHRDLEIFPSQTNFRLTPIPALDRFPSYTDFRIIYHSFYMEFTAYIIIIAVKISF